MDDDNSIIQDNAQATLNALVNAIESLTVLQLAASKQLNLEQENEAITADTVAAITGLYHLLHTIRNGSVSCYEQFQAEKRRQQQQEQQQEQLPLTGEQARQVLKEGEAPR